MGLLVLFFAFNSNAELAATGTFAAPGIASASGTAIPDHALGLGLSAMMGEHHRAWAGIASGSRQLRPSHRTHARHPGRDSIKSGAMGARAGGGGARAGGRLLASW